MFSSAIDGSWVTSKRLCQTLRFDSRTTSNLSAISKSPKELVILMKIHSQKHVIKQTNRKKVTFLQSASQFQSILAIIMTHWCHHHKIIATKLMNYKKVKTKREHRKITQNVYALQAERRWSKEFLETKKEKKWRMKKKN